MLYNTLIIDMRTYIISSMYNKIDVCISDIIRLKNYLDRFVRGFLQNHPHCQEQFSPIEIFDPARSKKVTDLYKCFIF